MGDSSGQGILSRIKAFETQKDSENVANNAQSSKRPEVAPRTFVPKPGVVQGRPTVAPKPSLVDRISGESNNGAEAKPVAAERQGPILPPKSQTGSAPVGPKPEPPKKPKPSISAESKQNDQTCNTLDRREEAPSDSVATQIGRPAVRRNQMPIPTPRPTMAKQPNTAENRIAPFITPKPPASRSSVLPITKTSMMEAEGYSTNIQISPISAQDLISFDDDVMPAIPTGDNVTSLVTVDPFQTLPRNKAPPTDVMHSRPPVLRKPTVIRIPSKLSKTSSEDIASPPPLPTETPVGNLIVERSKTVPMENHDLPGPAASQPVARVGKVPPARPAPHKTGPARPPPPKVSAAPNQLRHASSEQKINKTVGKQSPSATGKVRPKSQVLQKKGPELPPRPAPGHPLYNKYMKLSASDQQFGDSSGPHALVLHDFTADQNDELNLKAGDTVYLLKKLDKDWISGKCKGHTGIFPANFVKIIVDLPADSQEISVKKDLFKPTSLNKGPRCVARFDFEGDQPDELTFFEGDVIALKGYMNEEWARGELKGCLGIFPLNFVDLVEDLPTSEQKTIQSSPLSPGSNRPTDDRTIETSTPDQVGDLDLQWCEALYDFKAEAADDLSFKRGDQILILEQIDSEWYKGKLNGLEGIFPSAFVRVCSGW